MAELAELDEAVEAIYDRVDGSYSGLNRDYIRTVLHAAQEEFGHDYAADTSPCPSRSQDGVPRRWQTRSDGELCLIQT